MLTLLKIIDGVCRRLLRPKHLVKVPRKPKIQTNYRIFIMIKAKHLNKYENISKLLGELLGKLVNETVGIPNYITQK